MNAQGPEDLPDRIVVRLASPALFVGASADGTGADTDVVTDAHGLPHLPRHRLAARLRAGAVSAATVAPDLAGAVELLFGRGRSHGPDRILRVGHALPGDGVRAAVARALEGRAEPVRSTLRRAVSDAHTTLESGVEIGPHGAPEPGRLRTNRVLLPGLTLTATLTWATPPGEEHWRCLARACLATDQIGLRAARGRGRVDVRLARSEDPDPHATTLSLAAPPARPPDPARWEGART
ncbi:hypothetical protein GCM10007079_28820 [Nocardiopsis terrae]|uniref:RAMP superfamily protein n=1 Tax=Nocardiopsis terrae TaxID=372655 RepID=A0ABR9HER4_9ACTN|nr:hypothetical protein [Nocardiopsis terrae]MBE1457516.1 hypothetical protein [Nocardiopsis terrae]GHC85694.1 hypothetical protein GCM10007079_28820 [Nocardiopsis terrae]